MRVILLTDVPKVGVRHQVKDFKDGFAQNVLIAKGLAVMATPKALADLEKRKSEMKNKVNEEMRTFDDLLNNLKNQKIIINVKANEKGHLFKAVGPHDVALAIKEITGLEIDEKYLVMDNAKKIGNCMVSIKKGDKKGEFQVEIKQS